MNDQLRLYRLGVVPYLNAQPLTYSLEKQPHEEVEVVADVPSRLAARLRRG